jgi:hypothetical protein
MCCRGHMGSLSSHPGVNEELMRLRAPVKVQEWIKQPPS